MIPSATSLKLRLTTVAVLIAFASLMLLPPSASAQTVAPHNSLPVPVSLNVTANNNTTGPLAALGTGTLTGTYYIQQFVNNNGKLGAVGTLVGTINGQMVALSNIPADVSVADPSCPILT